MPEPQKINVQFTDGSVDILEVEEFCPYEPSAYCLDAGWTCTLGNIEYFVSQGTGHVWEQPQNEIVGIAPEIKAASDRMEAQLTEAYEGK